MGRPDGGECAKATGSFDIADGADDDEWRSFDDGDGLDDFTLVHL